MNPSLGHLFYAFEGFEQDLREELLLFRIEILWQEGLIFFTSPTEYVPVWAKCHGPASVHVDESITRSATLLKSQGRLWACASNLQHRRSQLIQGQLFKKKSVALKFQGEIPQQPWGLWALLPQGKIVICPQTNSAFPLGEVTFEEDPQPPSRAYLKLWEVFTLHEPLGPQPQQRVIDLGSSPGGWTWVLSRMKCKVFSVDRADLQTKVLGPNVEHRRQDAFKINPDDVGQIDWLFSDLICYPDKLLTLVQKWHQAGVQNMVCTIKFQGKTDFESLQQFRSWENSKIVHLCANKHEVTWILKNK